MSLRVAWVSSREESNYSLRKQALIEGGIDMVEPIRTTKTVAAVPNFISTPADIAGVGVVNFISVVFSLVWALVLGATLLVKPDWRGSQASTAVTAAVVGE